MCRLKIDAQSRNETHRILKASLTLLLALLYTSMAWAQVTPTWRYYRVGNTGIQGDHHDALWIGPDGDPYIGGYDPIFEEGGFAKFLQSENRWLNFSNVDYPVIGHPNETGTARVSDIVVDAQGNLWMGTGVGALKFTPSVGPSSLVRYMSTNSTLPGGWTTGVEFAPDGTIWFSAYGTSYGPAGLARYNPATNTWSSFGQFGDGSLAVQPKPTSGYYVWTMNPWNGKIARFDSGTQTWTEYEQVTDAPWELPGKTCTDATGNTWMFRLTGPSYVLTTLDCRRPDGTWIHPPVPPTIMGVDPIWAFRAFGNMQALLVDANSTTWRFDGTSWADLGIWRPGLFTYDVGTDAAGNVWVCGVGGASKRNAQTGHWQRYRITNTGHFDNFTSDLTIDTDNNYIYAGANAAAGIGGMTRFDGQRWVGWNNSTYGLGFAWPFQNDNAQALAYRHSNGRVSVTPYWGYGIHEWTGSGFNTLQPAGGAKRMCEDSQGRLWEIGEYFNLSYYSGGVWTPVPILAWGQTIKKDPTRPGTVWAGTGYEVVRTDGTYRFSRTIANFPELTDNSDQFSGIAADSNGIAWIGCTVRGIGVYGVGGGLIRINANTGTYSLLRSDQNWPFPEEYVTPWAVTPDGRLWLQYSSRYPYTGRGLCWWDGVNIGFFPAPPGGEPQWGSLPHGQVEDLEVRSVPDGYELWMTCASRGIAVLEVRTNPLPIQLASFEGTVQTNGDIALTWVTLSEVNNYGFFIQRKRRNDHRYFEIPNGFVPGHGTTNERHMYGFTDSAPGTGTWMYRLKHVDLNGDVHYSEPIQIGVTAGVNEDAKPRAYALMQNYPNPFNPITTIKYEIPTGGFVTLRVFDVLGREVATLVNEEKVPGGYSASWDATNVGSGMYIYRLESNGQIETRKMVLMK